MHINNIQVVENNNVNKCNIIADTLGVWLVLIIALLYNLL